VKPQCIGYWSLTAVQNTAKFEAHLVGPSLYLVHTGVVTWGMLKGIQEYGAGSSTTHCHLAAWSLRKPSELSHLLEQNLNTWSPPVHNTDPGFTQFLHSPDRSLCLACY